jgi:signal transduction histidine kinase
MAPLQQEPKSSQADAKTSGLGVSLPLLFISLALLLLVSLICLYSWNAYIKSADQTRLSVAVVASLKNVISWLDRAETNEQAALLTQDSRYLRESARAVATVHNDLQDLIRLDSPRTNGLSALVEFNDAVKAKSADLETNLILIREKNAAAAIDSIKSIRGRLLMDHVRGIEQRLEEEEQERLITMRTRSRFFARLSQIVSTFGSAGIFAIVLLSTLRIRRLTKSGNTLTHELRRTNEDLRQFVYSASHDLQEPLRNLMIYADLMEKRILSGNFEVAREEARFIRIFANRMRALVTDLLLYTQITSAEPAPLAFADMNRVMSKVVESFSDAISESKAEIETGSLPRLPISESHAEQLMHNLVSNAIKYRRADQPPHVQVSAKRLRHEWIVSVADNGIGIDAHYYAHIFGIFKRLHTATEYPGTGLGLAICRKIVERAGGRIWVESQSGMGSTFYFSLPAAVSSIR